MKQEIGRDYLKVFNVSAVAHLTRGELPGVAEYPLEILIGEFV